MLHQRRLLAGLVVCVVTLGTVSARANFFSFAQTSLVTAASDGIGTPVRHTDNALVPLPWQLTRPVADGPSQSTTVYDFAEAGDAAVLTMTFDHSADGVSGNFAQGTGVLTVYPFEDLNYELSGSYALESAGSISLEVDFLEGGTSLFRNLQRSVATPDEAFALGGQGGDDANDLSGSLTGTLEAYKSYQLLYTYSVSDTGASPVASAMGDLTLTIQPVPEPVTAMLGLAGLVLLAPARRRR